MCNRARFAGELETLYARFNTSWARDAARPNLALTELAPRKKAYVIHLKAMITILHEADWDQWLTGSYNDVVALQRPYPAVEMTVRGPVFPTREQ